MKKKRLSKAMALLVSLALLVQLVIPANISADDGPAVPVLQAAVAPGTSSGSAKVTVTDAVYGSEDYALTVNITDTPVNVPEPGDPTPTEGEYLIADYESGSDITAGVAADKYLQVYAVYEDEGQRLAAAFYQKQLADGDIRHTGAAGTDGGLITAFATLAEDVRWQNTTEPGLPGTVEATVNGEAMQIPVTWQADHEYDAYMPEPGLYVFTAQPGEGYTVSEGVQAPRITVYIPAAQRMLLRMTAGAATQSDPLVITTAAQLAEVAVLVNAGGLESFITGSSTNTVYLELGNDLDLSGYGRNWNGGKGWVPIGNNTNGFKSSFDGGSHTVAGLYINDSSRDYAGLFGSVDGGMVENLALTAVDITVNECVGGVAGSIKGGGTVQDCSVTGTVSGSSNVGGIAGEAYGTGSTVQSCYANSTVSGTGSNTGGAVGIVGNNGSVQNCYTAGAVSGSFSVGGVAGSTGSDSTVQNCYAIGRVSGSFFVGGIAGANSGTIQNCAALNPGVQGAASFVGRVAGNNGYDILSGNVAFAGMTGGGSETTAGGLDGESKTAAQIAAANFFQDLFGNDTAWTYASGKLPGLGGTAVDLPVHIVEGSNPNFLGEGTVSNPFQIGTAEQLAKLAELVNDSGTNPVYGGVGVYYQLTNSIDLSGYGSAWNSGKGWIPIGNSTSRFQGYFDGGGKTVAGLYIYDGGRDYAGLFGYVEAGTVENFTLSGTVSGNNNVGVVVGYLDNSTIQNCHASGAVDGKSYNVGGVAGDVYNGSHMLNCSAAVAVSGASYTYNLGGVAGTVEKNSTMQNCYATGNVSGGNTTGGSAGGVVGNVYDGANTVQNCYATGAVSSKGSVGGVAGVVEYGTHTVKNCAALNPSVAGSLDIGRVAGYKESGSILSGNVAFNWILSGSGGQLSAADDSTGIHGASRTASNIADANFFQSVFDSSVADGAWTYAVGKLPGLNGTTVDLPGHLQSAGTSPFGGGDGTSESTAYEIGTPAQLAKLAELVNAGTAPYADEDKYYKLTADIDLSGYNASNTGFNGGNGWIPIGKAYTAPFKGYLDGNHKTVSGLYINDEFEMNCAGGMFGYLSTGGVYDLAVTDVNITTTGMGSTGIVAGCMDDPSFVENCYTAGSISGVSNVGGIAGVVGSGRGVKNCYTTATVSGSSNVGGIAGSGYAGTVENCYVTGNSTSNSASTGGVVGFFSYGTIQNCVALCPGMTQYEGARRILGLTYTTNTLANNHAFSGMISGGTDRNANGFDGADVSIQTVMSGLSFWQDTMNWDDGVWTITPGKLPTLTGFSGQSGDGGLYLAERDLQYATATVTGTYTYTGSPVTPAITVMFGTTTLVENTDYTIAITSTDDTDTGTSAGTNAGEVTITVTGIGNFTGTKTAVFTIEPKELTADMVTVTGGSFTYTGVVQQPVIAVQDGSTMLVLNTDYENVTYADNTNAGTAASVSIAGKGNYQGTVNKSFTIAKAPLTITGGTAAAKTYDNTTGATVTAVTFGGLQNGESFTLGTDYTVAGTMFDSANAGGGKTVTGTVTLNATVKANNYSLANGSLSILGQTIAKATTSGVDQTVEVVKGHAQDYSFDLTTLLPSVTGTLGTVTYDPVITANSDGVLGTLSYSPGSTLTLPVQSVADTGKTATVTVTVSSENYNNFNASITVETVDTIPLTVTGITLNDKVYDGTDTASLSGTAALDTTNIAPGDDVNLSGTASAAFIDPDAGANKAVVITGLSLTGSDAYKYRLELSGFTGTITAKELTEYMVTVTGGPFTYTGAVQQPGITVKDGSTMLVLNTDYENVTYADNTNAGMAASVSIAGKGNYQGMVNKSFTIAKAPLTITGGTLAAKTYDNTTGATITAVTFGGLQNGESLMLGTDYAATGAHFDSADAGSGRNVTATVTLSNTVKAGNYALTDGSLTLSGQTIGKGTVANVTTNISVYKNMANDYEMDYATFSEILNLLTGKSLGNIAYSITSVVNTDGVLATEPPAGPVSFPVTMSVAKIADAGKEARITGTVTSPNFNDFTATAVVTTVDKIPVTVSGVTMTGGVYNGTPYAYSGVPVFTLPAGGGAVSIEGFDVLYESTDGTVYSSQAAPKNAGAYKLTLSVPEKSIYTGSQVYSFTIEKRGVTVRVDDKTMIMGEALPVFTYTVYGQLPGETALTGTPTVSCAADGKTAGSYPIAVDLTGVAYTGNYKAAGTALIGGTLTVNKLPVINITTVSGVTVPVRGSIPVSSITETAQYTGTVAWNPAHSTFAANTVYTATITLTPKAGYGLDGVTANCFTVAGAALVSNAADSGVITAVFPATAATPNNNSGNDGGNSGSTGGSGGTNTTPTTPPAQQQQPQTSTTVNNAAATLSATAAAGTGGTATASLTQSQLQDAVNEALEAARNQGGGTAASVEIQITAPADATSVETSLPRAAVGTAAAGGLQALTVSSSVASITFDSNALSTIARGTGEDVSIIASRLNSSSISTEVRQLVGNRPVFDFSVTSGGSSITQFGGNVTVSVPYTPSAGEDLDAIVIYYIGEGGQPQLISNCVYDPSTGRVTFNTSHFSKYAVGYNKISFKDVPANAWYGKAVCFIAAREISGGTGDGNFSPDAKLTRGQFIVMLMKAYGIAPDTNPKDNFTDAGSTYYTGYLAAAKRLGISGGVGNDMFAPEKEITRQEMFTLLYNALKAIDKLPKVSSGKTLSSFSDAGELASWAKDAMSIMVRAGITGGSGGKLSPTAAATRAEMAQVLYNLLSK